MADYCTTTQVRDYVDFKDDTKTIDNDLIGDLITRASKRIDDYCRRTFVERTETRNFDAVLDVQGQRLWVDDDLLAVDSITNGDGTSITSGQYVLEPANDSPKYAIKLLASSGQSWTYTTDPEQAIAVTGDWGYEAGTTAPADIQHATIRLVAWYYQQREAPFETVAFPELGAVTVPQAIPPDIVAILNSYVRQQVARVGGRR
ncbi:MAG: hypothetical protein ACYTEQ_06510 [Planctomycetota bacterium]|jgi:hypothetical protein